MWRRGSQLAGDACTGAYAQPEHADFNAGDQHVIVIYERNGRAGCGIWLSDCFGKWRFVVKTYDTMRIIDLNDAVSLANTGGFDANCCLPNNNESLNWRLIGTTGVQNPGGSVPEPASVLLLGSGLVGLAAWLRKQQRLNKTA